jgi:GT2 family glycosyltransferase
LLERVLAGIADLEYPAFSVVVVDDGSESDEAKRNEALAATYGARYVHQPNTGPGAARNRGVAVSGSDLVAFLDDDCFPDKRWLQAFARHWTRTHSPALGAMGGKIQSGRAETWTGRFAAAARFQTGESCASPVINTANACFSRRVLDEVEGFDESFYRGAEDSDLSTRVKQAGYEVQYVSEAVITHTDPATLSDLLDRLYHRGKGETVARRKEGRVWWVVLRAALFPAYCARRAAQAWSVSAGEATRPERASYALMAGITALWYVAGSLAALPDRTRTGR